MIDIKWIRPSAWEALTGNSSDYIRNRIEDGDWAEGIHYKRTGERTLWVNARAIDDWVEKHACVQSKTHLKGLKSEGRASA